MGAGGISMWQLLIVLAIVVLLFGTRRLRTLGGDLGSALRGFRESMRDPEGSADARDGSAETAEKRLQDGSEGAVAAEGRPAREDGQAA